MLILRLKTEIHKYGVSVQPLNHVIWPFRHMFILYHNIQFAEIPVHCLDTFTQGLYL